MSTERMYRSSTRNEFHPPFRTEEDQRCPLAEGSDVFDDMSMSCAMSCPSQSVLYDFRVNIVLTSAQGMFHLSHISAYHGKSTPPVSRNTYLSCRLKIEEKLFLGLFAYPASQCLPSGGLPPPSNISLINVVPLRVSGIC